MTAGNEKAVYAGVNYGEAVCPNEIMKQSICLDTDIGKVMKDIGKAMNDMI